MKEKGLPQPEDFGINTGELPPWQKARLVVGELAVGLWAEPGQDNKQLTGLYAACAAF